VLGAQVQPAAYKMAVPFGATLACRRMAVPASVWVTDWRTMAVPATVWVAPAAKTGSAIPAAGDGKGKAGRPALTLHGNILLGADPLGRRH